MSFALDFRESLDRSFSTIFDHMHSRNEEICSGVTQSTIEIARETISTQIGQMIPENQKSAPTDLSKREVTKHQKTMQILIAIGVISIVGLTVCGLLGIFLTPWLLIPATVFAIAGIGTLIYYYYQSPDFEDPVVRQEYITRLTCRDLSWISEELSSRNCSQEQLVGYSLLGYRTSAIAYAAFCALNNCYWELKAEKAIAISEVSKVYQLTLEPSSNAARVARERENLVREKYDSRPPELRRTYSAQIERAAAAADVKDADLRLFSMKEEAVRLRNRAIAKIDQEFDRVVRLINAEFKYYSEL